MGAAVPALVVLCRKDASGVTTDQTSRGATPLVVVATDRSTRQNATRPTDQSGAWLLLLLVNNNTFNVWRTVNKDVSTNTNIPSRGCGGSRRNGTDNPPTPRHATPGRLISWHYQNSTDRPGHQGSKGEEKKKTWRIRAGTNNAGVVVGAVVVDETFRSPLARLRTACLSASRPLLETGGEASVAVIRSIKAKVCRLSAVYARPEF